MTDVPAAGLSRRDLLKNTGRVAAASALSGLVLPRAYAGEDNTINLALVGSGGRGTGAGLRRPRISAGVIPSSTASALRACSICAS